MSSPVDIANMALSEIGAENTIASLDENSLAAREAKRVYDTVLREMLEVHDWSFATKRVALAALAAGGFAVPDDCGTPRAVYSTADPYPYEHAFDYTIDAGVLHCVLPAPYLEYGASTVPEAVMPAMFVRAFALELASRLAMPIKQDRAVKGDVIQQAEIAKQRATADDKNRQPMRTPDYPDDVLIARGGGWGYAAIDRYR